MLAGGQDSAQGRRTPCRLIRRDARRGDLARLDRPFKERVRCSNVAPGAQGAIDDLALLINRPIQLMPALSGLDVGFVHAPATTNRAVPPKRIAWGPAANPALREAILAVVEQQLRDDNPPEPRRTYERLVAQGYAPHDARRLIGNVVAQEIVAVMQRGEVYHEQQYILALRGLPESAV